MKKVLVYTLILLVILLSCIAYAADCPTGYRWCRMCANNCVQEKCPEHAHYSSTDHCICSSDDFIDDPAEDQYNKSCRKKFDDPACPGCLESCILPTELCPDEKKLLPPGIPQQSGNATPPEAGSTTAAANNTPRWEDIEKNLTRDKSTISHQEFIEYLKTLEEKNPDKNWKQLITKLHAEQYPHDLTRVEAGFQLFVWGPDTEGYQTVDKVTRFVPYFVTGPNGEKIDIRHSYAGLRSGLNRDAGVVRGIVHRMNTNWGDTYQTLIHWDDAYYPNDQYLGNEIGHWLYNYYSKKKTRIKS
jgi:hypothetical protein